MTGDGGKLTAKPEWPLWLDWLDARLRPGTRDQGSHPRRRAFRWAGYSGGGDHSFPTARARLQAAIQQAREQWAAGRIRVHSHIPGAAPELLNAWRAWALRPEARPRCGWPDGPCARPAGVADSECDGRLYLAGRRGRRHDRSCSGFSTLASGKQHGRICANFSRVGKKLRIQSGIDTQRLEWVETCRSDFARRTTGLDQKRIWSRG